MVMNFIYTDENRNDIGYMPESKIDIAFGSDENNFQIDSKTDFMKNGYFFYLDGSEYGGIIDEIKSNTKTKTITYTGRTWHGILNSKVLCPEQSEDYLTVSGNINEILTYLLERCNLTGLFSVAEENSEIEIDEFQFERYVKLYDGLREMTKKNNQKIIFRFDNIMKKIIISTSRIKNYSEEEEWNSEQVKMILQKNFNKINHLICLGTGELKERAVIHLYTDEFGEVQPYATEEFPQEDADYILDNRNQVFFGNQDRTEIYDYTGAQTAENFIMITEIPHDWNTYYTKYYERDNNGNYNQLERKYSDRYTLLTSSPADWRDNYTTYYKKSGNTYTLLTNDGVDVETPLTWDTEPPGWNDKKNWKKGGTNKKGWYYNYSDGHTIEPRLIPMDEYQARGKDFKYKPTDWKKNKGNYYIEAFEETYWYEIKKKSSITGKWQTSVGPLKEKIKNKKTSTQIVTLLFSTQEPLGTMKISEYVNKGYAKMSDFNDFKKVSKKFNGVFDMVTKYKIPKFSKYHNNGGVFTYVRGKEAPTFEQNKYYRRDEHIEVVPPFVREKYFRKSYDRYADLVKNGIEKLREYWAEKQIETSIDAEQEYQIGDIVAAYDKITNTSVYASISKKILKVDENGKTTINYEVS